MTIAHEVEQCRAQAVLEGARLKDPQLVLERLSDFYSTLPPEQKHEADQVFISWLRYEDEDRWHAGLNMVTHLHITAAVPFLLQLADRFSRENAPGAPMWAETLQNAAWRLENLKVG